MLHRRRYDNEQTLAARAAGLSAQPAQAQPETVSYSDHLLALEDLRRSLQGAAPAPSEELGALKAELAAAQERIAELEASLESASKEPEAPAETDAPAPSEDAAPAPVKRAAKASSKRK
jgi:chromosome segregation ATPase